MRLRTKSWLAACAFVTLARPAAAGDLVDLVAATVDKEVVLYSSLMIQIGRELESLRKTATSSQDFENKAEPLVRQALEESINTLLLAREARKIPQLEVTDKELDLDEEQIRKDYDTPEDFVRAVGSVSEFRERRRQMTLARRMSAVRMDSFESEVVVSEDEINTYYQEHLDKYEKPERVFLRQIFLRVRDEADRPQAREKLEQLRQEILAGTDFADLAKQHSQALGAEVGGIVGEDGWNERSTDGKSGDLNEAIEQAAFALPAGGLSEVLDTSFGVHLLRVDQHEQAGAANMNEVRLEIEQTLRREAAQKKYDTWLDDLRKRSRVRIFL
jgi:peptidyl-prolyl cis-trans isomerase SurA